MFALANNSNCDLVNKAPFGCERTVLRKVHLCGWQQAAGSGQRKLIKEPESLRAARERGYQI